MRKSAPHSDAQARAAFAKRLSAARVMAGFDTQKEFAAEVGIEAETYRRYERGETEPGIAGLIKLARGLKQSLDFLVAGKSHPPEPAASSKKAAA